MERGKDKRNILIGALLTIILVMSVGFALLGETLEITATGTTSGDWVVKFKSNSLSQVSKTDGVKDITAQMGENDLLVTIDATFEKPGDVLVYRVAVENAGSIDAYLKDVKVVGTEGNTDAIKLSYTVKNNDMTQTYAKGSIVQMTGEEEVEPTTDSKLLKKVVSDQTTTYDHHYVDITLEYISTETAVSSGAEATYSVKLEYEQTAAIQNEN